MSRQANKRILRAYGKVPKVACKGFCWNYCAIAPMSEAEKNRIAARHPEYVAEVHESVERPPGYPPIYALPVDAGLRCQALTADHRCAIYEDRPLICRAFGVADGMMCPYGCEPEDVLSREEVMRLAIECE